MGNHYLTLFARIIYWTEWKTTTLYMYDFNLSKMQVKFGKGNPYHPGSLSKNVH